MAGRIEIRGMALRGALALAALLVLASCEPAYGPNPSGEVTLPEATTRIDARAMREAQLKTGTMRDDIPEYTGAPSARGTWPAPVGSAGRSVYRDADGLVIGSEGPYARNR